jgi:hypothetical protein
MLSLRDQIKDALHQVLLVGNATLQWAEGMGVINNVIMKSVTRLHNKISKSMVDLMIDEKQLSHKQSKKSFASNTSWEIAQVWVNDIRLKTNRAQKLLTEAYSLNPALDSQIVPLQQNLDEYMLLWDDFLEDVKTVPYSRKNKENSIPHTTQEDLNTDLGISTDIAEDIIKGLADAYKKITKIKANTTEEKVLVDGVCQRLRQLENLVGRAQDQQNEVLWEQAYKNSPI